MATFRVISRTAAVPVPPKKQPRRLSEGWSAFLRFFLAMNIGAWLFVALRTITGSDYTFILLPVFLSFFVTISRGYSFNAIFNTLLSGTPLYFLLTACLTLGYYGFIIIGDLLAHPSSSFAPVILVATVLAWAIMFEPLRVYLQALIERRFNVRDRERARAIDAFVTTLREEIDLAQLCEHFLTVIQQTTGPYLVSFWVRAVTQQQELPASQEEVSVADDDPLLTYLLQHPEATKLNRLLLESPLLQDIKGRKVELLVPLASQGELIGLLLLGLRLDGEEYARTDRNVLNTLATQVAPALRVAQMVQEQQAQVRERERIEQEMRTAQAIQHAFLPKEVPALTGWHLVPYYQPAREVGGDFYDFLAFADGRLGLVIGDVTGKGVPAALVMATVHTMLRSAVQGTTSPSEVLARVNDLLIAEIPTGMFVTCFFALLDPQSGHICYANAGHEAPYRWLNGKASELLATGMPLGMLPGVCYDEYEAMLAPGECLLLYSDGLVEAHNPAREMFGFPRLQTLLARQHTNETPTIDFVLSELKSFTGEGWEQEDDVTLLALQRLAG
ncbi:MAG TPA: PP2C family protein-serine/threonine phosphatase [Ktedonobacteraceae bacterium]|jgi:serine phosphatase RsbU (regulator of sigma subunit)|nr:PP2C family protein-serine/threonine phosphatase [Ktedonobacteraceae bacterium]